MQHKNVIEGLELLLRNRDHFQLRPDEFELLRESVCEVRELSRGQVAVRQGEEVQISTLLLQGMMTRKVDGRDGRRHLVAVHFPGEFVDLHAYTLKHLDHDVAALTNVKIAVFRHEQLMKIQADHPALTRRLWFSTLLDAALHRQWVYRLSCLDAASRVAHFICETNARLMAIGVSGGRKFGLPMTQSEIGEVCGLTNVHVSRVLRRLRDLKLCDVSRSVVDILDLRGLAELGQFQPDYLYLRSAIATASMGQAPGRAGPGK